LAAELQMGWLLSQRVCRRGGRVGSAATLPRPVASDGLPEEGAVLARAGGENFPVALRLLPPAVRADLLAVYGYARLTDELGDAYSGDRLAALDQLDGELRAAVAGGPGSPPVVAPVG